MKLAGGRDQHSIHGFCLNGGFDVRKPGSRWRGFEGALGASLVWLNNGRNVCANDALFDANNVVGPH